MSKIASPRILHLCLSFASCFILTSTSKADSEKPNIVFIFADDQCFSTINALGASGIETPNLDALAKQGTTFSHAYNMGSWSGAVCIASRTMLNSGRFVWNANAIHGQSERERSQGRWWSEYLKQAGYRTYMTGKWHCRANAEKAFDVARDIRPGMPKAVELGYNRPLPDGSDPWSPSDPKFGGFWEGGTHWSEVVANHAEDFLDEAQNDDSPFFMYLAFNAPHDPRQAPQSYIDRYPASKVAIPKNFQPLYPFADAIGCGESLRDERLAPFPRTSHAIQVHRSEYYALITHMDAQIGRILKAIEKSGKADNTWIFFTADHGLAVGQHGLLGKQNMYDHSVRVPFIVNGPGVQTDRTIAEPIYLQDIMPTTLQLAGVPKPKHVEFNSLLPLLDGGVSPYPFIYGCYLQKQRSIRSRTHKLIVYPEAPAFRLYNLADDPLELHDISNIPSNKNLVLELFDQLVNLQHQMQDDLDLTSMRP